MLQQHIFPVPWFYAVICMDPVAMVEDLGLNDAETLAAVAGFNPKKYLVYVNLVSPSLSALIVMNGTCS